MKHEAPVVDGGVAHIFLYLWFLTTEDCWFVVFFCFLFFI